MRKNWVYRRKDLYLADLGKPVGSQQGGVRPVVVVQNDIGNYHSPTLTIVPLTTKTEKKVEMPTHYLIRSAKGLKYPSMALAEQIGTYDKSCILEYLGYCSDRQMHFIDNAVRIQLGYYLDEKRTRHYKKRPGE